MPIAFLFRVARSYRTALELRPMLTQSLTSGVLYGCGDAIAQKVESRLKIESPGKEGFNWGRTLRMGFFGAAIGGPLMCVWYQQLDRATTLYRVHFNPVVGHEGLNWLFERTPGLKWVASLHHARELPSVWTDVSAKLVADLAFFTPAFINLYLLSMGVLERKSWPDIREKLTGQFHNAWGVCMMLWLPVQLINFRYVPVEFQGVVVGAANVIWKSILSFIMHFSDYNTDTYREMRAAQSDANYLEHAIAQRDNRIRQLEAEVLQLRTQLGAVAKGGSKLRSWVTQHGGARPSPAERAGEAQVPTRELPPVFPGVTGPGVTGGSSTVPIRRGPLGIGGHDPLELLIIADGS